jgi:hypothetical protein
MRTHIFQEAQMLFPVKSVAELGLLVRATRRTHHLRMDDVAINANLGPTFAFDLEHGKATVQLGRVLRLLEELGIRMVVDIPSVALPEIEKLHKKGIPPHRPRKPKSA